MSNPRGPARCGTPSGYNRHMREHTTPCQPCRIAQAAAMADSRARNRKVYPVCDCGRKVTATGEDKCSLCRKQGRRCECGRQIRNPDREQCSFCLSGKRTPEDVEVLIENTVIEWVNDGGVMRAVVVEDPVPDGPTRAAARMFQDVS